MKPKSVPDRPAYALLKAKDIMRSPVLAATPQAVLRDVAIQLVSNEFSGMPIGAPDGQVLGVVTESDILRTLIEGKRLESLTATEVTTGPPITVDVDTPMHEVMRKLEDYRIVRVPVTEKGVLIGIISRRDVIKAVVEPEFVAWGRSRTT